MTRIVATAKEDEIIDLVIQSYFLPYLAADEFTAGMIAERTGYTARQASYILAEAVKRGEMTVRDARNANGRRVKAYRMVTE